MEGATITFYVSHSMPPRSTHMSIAIPPAVFLDDRLDYWAARTPAKAAFIYGEKSWTYAQWSDRVRRVSGGLEAAGIKLGDRVAFLDKNHPSCLEVTYG